MQTSHAPMVHTQILLLMWRRKNWRVCGSFRSEFSGAPEIVDAKSTSSRSKGMKSNVIGLSRIECGLSIQLPSSGDTHGCVRVWGTQRWNLQSTFAGPSFRFVVPSSLVLIPTVSTKWWTRGNGIRGFVSLRCAVRSRQRPMSFDSKNGGRERTVHVASKTKQVQCA